MHLAGNKWPTGESKKSGVLLQNSPLRTVEMIWKGKVRRRWCPDLEPSSIMQWMSEWHYWYKEVQICCWTLTYETAQLPGVCVLHGIREKLPSLNLPCHFLESKQYFCLRNIAVSSTACLPGRSKQTMQRSMPTGALVLIAVKKRTLSCLIYLWTDGLLITQ